MEVVDTDDNATFQDEDFSNPSLIRVGGRKRRRGIGSSLDLADTMLDLGGGELGLGSAEARAAQRRAARARLGARARLSARGGRGRGRGSLLSSISSISSVGSDDDDYMNPIYYQLRQNLPSSLPQRPRGGRRPGGGGGGGGGGGPGGGGGGPGGGDGGPGGGDGGPGGPGGGPGGGRWSIFPPPRRVNRVLFRNPPREGLDVDNRKLLDLVVDQGRGIRYNRNVLTQEGANQYLQRRGLNNWAVEAGDFDNDPNTPDNVLVVDDNANLRFADGYYFGKRRPDVLYRDAGYTGQVHHYDDQLRQGLINEEDARKQKSELKHYFKTHITPQSRVDEPFDEWLARYRANKHEHLFHKMFLDSTRDHPDQRTRENEQAFYNQWSPLLQDSPSLLMRRLIANRIRQLEAQNNVRFNDKIRLMSQIYSQHINNFKNVNNIPFASPITTFQSANAFLLLQNVDFNNVFQNTLQAHLIAGNLPQ
jgi:hypothetical protein